VAIDILRLTVWLALLAAIFVPLERLCAVRRQRIWRRDTGIDLAYYSINSLVLASVLAFPLALLAGMVRWAMPAALPGAVDMLPFWARLGLAYLVAELGFYWGHRWSHQVPLLWRFHQVHHSAEEIDFLTNTRAHPVDMVFTRLCGLVPVFALGLAQTGGQNALVAPVVVVIGSFWGFFIHANIGWRFGWLEALVTTPAFHHWHHTNDEHRDHNYAAVLPAYDRLFGTHHLPKAWPARYGTDAPVPPGLADQLVEPFMPPGRPPG
jgi:sterol desaturase/sphingolipid hydroxylase (fatty acid hydroxylase superfamily)